MKGKLLYDDLTRKYYEIFEEKIVDELTAVIGVVYLLLMLGFFFWQLFDIWIGQFTLAHWVGYDSKDTLNSDNFRIIAYTFIGGGLGGIVNGIRSILVWHCERQVFGRRFIWKYITGPWVGTALALFAYALINSGVAVFGVDFSQADLGKDHTLAMFATGILAGYGSREVFGWLDAQVKKIFKVVSSLTVPDLTGRTQEEAEKVLQDFNLRGKTLEEPEENDELIGKVIKQSPIAGSPIDSGEKVDITIAVKKEG